MTTHTHRLTPFLRLLAPAAAACLLLASLPDAQAGGGRRGQRAGQPQAQRGNGQRGQRGHAQRGPGERGPGQRGHRAHPDDGQGERGGQGAGHSGRGGHSSREGREGRDGNGARNGARRGGRVRASLARTHVLLVAARASIRRGGGSGRGRFAAAALHQRAAGIALRRKAPRAALYLTRRAREAARAIIRTNRAGEPRGAADRPGEFAAADGASVAQYLDAARKRRRDPRMDRSLGRSGTLLGAAARAGKRGGRGSAALRRAAVLQRAARAAGQRGQWKVALHLTGQSRKSSREALAANGVAEPASTADETGEFSEASTEDATTYVAEAEAAVPEQVDEEVVEKVEEEPAADAATSDVAKAEAEVDFESYEYQLEADASASSASETKPDADTEEKPDPAASETEAP